MDYDKDCKRCGRCCAPAYVFKKKEFVRLPLLKCKYMDENKMCTIYEDRLEIDGCNLAKDVGVHLPLGCPFGGTVRELSSSEIIEFTDDPPPEFLGSLIAGLYTYG